MELARSPTRAIHGLRTIVACLHNLKDIFHVLCAEIKGNVSKITNMKLQIFTKTFERDFFSIFPHAILVLKAMDHVTRFLPYQHC